MTHSFNLGFDPSVFKSQRKIAPIEIEVPISELVVPTEKSGRTKKELREKADPSRNPTSYVKKKSPTCSFGFRISVRWKTRTQLWSQEMEKVIPKFNAKEFYRACIESGMASLESQLDPEDVKKLHKYLDQ